MTAEPQMKRTPARRKAREPAKHLRAERPDYSYLKQVFRHLREELGVEVERAPKKLPHVPTEQEIRSFYNAVWNARRGQDVVMIKTLLYTGVRVSELVSIRIGDVDLDRCRIRIEHGKGKKDRYVPFPASFKETLALHIHAQKQARASHLFESSWKKPYSDRGVRKILARHATAAGIQRPISPPPAPPLPVHLAKDPGHRRRAHPALLRPRHPPITRDLLAHRTRRRPASLRSSDRPLPRCDRGKPRGSITPLVCGW